MRLYLDDDTASPLLAKLLGKAAHDVVMPSEIGTAGAPDAVHLTHALLNNRICITKNHVTSGSCTT
jgi:predicted nuclease of predicted toxin-antitoxin system